MSDKRYLVLDIETITDWDLARRVFCLAPECSEEEARQELFQKYPSGFPPPAFHIPICIALIDVDFETFKVENATVMQNADEKQLLESFWNAARVRKGNKKVQTTYVTFNGRCFDFPCLFLRSAKHRVQVATYNRNRYSFEGSHDICDDLSEFGAAGRPSLDLIAKLLGLPGKTDTKGEMVEALYKGGDIQRIKDYCMDDTLTTYWVWLTLKYIRGEVSEPLYREAFDSASAKVASCRSVTDGFFSSQNP